MKYISIVLLALISMNVQAQLQSNVSFPVSPEVASLGKFVDMPVGTYTGVPDISVPLYTVKYKSISIPLALSYHAGGNKVNAEASWVGLGWDLFSGGYISQAMVGDSELNHDDMALPGGYSTFDSRLNSNQYITVNEINPQNLGCEVIGSYGAQELTIFDFLKAGWGQPDIYSFSFPGHSGKFVLDWTTKEPIILNKTEEIKIERLGTATQRVWKVKTLDGKTYTFSKKGRGITNTHVSAETWKLTSIRSYDGAEVTFEYAEQYTELSDVSEYYKSDVFEASEDRHGGSSQ